MLQPAAAGPDRLKGWYAFYDDGWPCTLAIRRADDGWSARFASYDRTEGRFEAELTVHPTLPHRVKLVVSRFNEVDQQVYEGYVFTRGVAGIAGTTEWKGEPYGFFARRHPPYSIGPPLPGAARPADFLGSYSVYCDGEHATLELAHLDGTTLRGTLREDGGGVAFPVVASVDLAVPYQTEITVHDLPAGGGRSPTMSVWMFSRPRTALAGWLRWGETRLGCYLAKFGLPAGAGPTTAARGTQ